MSLARFLLAAICLSATLESSLARAGDRSFDAVVQRLNADSYHARDAARQTLLQAGDQTNSTAQDVIAALQRGLEHPILEVRLACGELIRQLEQANIDQQIARLLNPRVVAAEIQLPGWTICSQLLGDDTPARKHFAALYRQYPTQLKLVESPLSMPRVRQMIANFDPYRIASEDLNQWTMLLILETLYASEQTRNLTSRSCMSLSSSHLGPKAASQQESIILERIIDHWIVSQRERCPTRERLLIAMRYDCHQRAARVCSDVLADPDSAPETQVMAMLCASAIELGDCESLIHSRLDDHRTAHVWHLIASRKTRIRTQVRDVALALLLHHRGIDPREVGFQELQADPLLIYRDHSLGFSDDESRERTHHKAMERLFPDKD